jgi:3-phosphoshikimate 1-carboxyvinyltransferase
MSSVRTAPGTPARRFQGHRRVPGDKSISHRYALMVAFARSHSELRNYAPGADCRSILICVAALAADAPVSGGDTVTLMGRGLRSFRSPTGPVDAGNSGMAMRMMTRELAFEADQLRGLDARPDHFGSGRPNRDWAVAHRAG